MNEFDREWLTDMLDYALLARRILGSADARGVEADERTFLALSYAVQTIGEAANRVSPGCRESLPDVPWPKIIGMRHRMAHGYRARSAAIIVQTVREDIPPLVEILEHKLSGNRP